MVKVNKAEKNMAQKNGSRKIKTKKKEVIKLQRRTPVEINEETKSYSRGPFQAHTSSMPGRPSSVHQGSKAFQNNFVMDPAKVQGARSAWAQYFPASTIGNDDALPFVPDQFPTAVARFSDVRTQNVSVAAAASTMEVVMAIGQSMALTIFAVKTIRDGVSVVTRYDSQMASPVVVNYAYGCCTGAELTVTCDTAEIDFGAVARIISLPADAQPISGGYGGLDIDSVNFAQLGTYPQAIEMVMSADSKGRGLRCPILFQSTTDQNFDATGVVPVQLYPGGGPFGVTKSVAYVCILITKPDKTQQFTVRRSACFAAQPFLKAQELVGSEARVSDVATYSRCMNGLAASVTAESKVTADPVAAEKAAPSILTGLANVVLEGVGGSLGIPKPLLRMAESAISGVSNGVAKAATSLWSSITSLFDADSEYCISRMKIMPVEIEACLRLEESKELPVGYVNLLKKLAAYDIRQVLQHTRTSKVPRKLGYSWSEPGQRARVLGRTPAGAVSEEGAVLLT